MSDETPDDNLNPGTTASDGTSASKLPRFSRSERPTGEPFSAAVKSLNEAVAGDKAPGAAKSSADQSRGADKPAYGKSPQQKSNHDSKGSADDSATQGSDSSESANDRIAAATPTSKRPHKPVVKAETGRPGSNPGSGSGPVSKPGSGSPSSRPLTAGEYARTTNPSPETTAVIPAVRDEPPQRSVTQTAAQANSGGGGRQASLKLVRVDPWTVTKVTFALTVALMIVAVVATTILWVVLSIAGVWDQINSSVATVLSDDSGSFDITEYLGFWRIVGLALVLSAINVVITTAVATIGAYLYNLAAQLLGGVDVTLAEED